MWIFLILFSFGAWAFPVLHFIKPESNFTQISTLDSCSTYTYTEDVAGCNPALFPFQRRQGINMGLSTITDGESVDVGKKLLFDPIKKEFLNELFEKRAFNSWGLNSYIDLRTSVFNLSYAPLMVNADIYVFNPASPEVAMSLVKSNRLQITTGTSFVNNDYLYGSVGTKIYYNRSEYFQNSFFLSELTSQDIKDLLKLRDKMYVAGDIGVFLKFKSSFLPKISMVAKNLNSGFTIKDKDVVAENQMRPLMVYETYSKLALGYDYKTQYGIFSTEASAPFEGIYENLYSEYLALSFGYSLTRFSTNIAYSKYQQIIGFNFGSKLASVGVFYGNSRPLGDFSNQTERVGGIRAEVSL